MNREILFRGKRVDGKGWAYGNLCKCENLLGDIFYEIGYGKKHYRVIPSTVGQFTGLTDKNGTKIFEGDRLIWEIGGEKINVVAVFQEGKFGGRIESYHHISHHIELSYLAITSNIHDNPTT